MSTPVLTFLRQTKNNLIGNPTAKLALQREGAIPTIVEYLNAPHTAIEYSGGSATEVRIEAARVIASLAYGPPEIVQSLLVARAHEAILYAISDLQQHDSLALKVSLARALRALAIAAAEVVGPGIWGLEDEGHQSCTEARPALECLFQPQALDDYLPLLSESSTQIKVAISQLLASTMRIPEHRTNVTEWVPPADRVKTAKGKRGWEKMVLVPANSPSKYGGWIAQNLTTMLQSSDLKVQEASLSALAALAKENPSLAITLTKLPDREVHSALSMAINLSRSRQSDVRLAACLCAARILRAGAPNYTSSCNTASSWTLLHVLNSVIVNSLESDVARARACFIMCVLVVDDKELCEVAVKSSSLLKLSDLLKSITSVSKPQEWDDGEPESVSELREAALTAIASLTLFDNETRHQVTGSLCLLPFISACLSHPHAGVRFGACQCIRALSREVSVLRTNILDSGLGLDLFAIIENQGEDRRVVAAALAGICNLVNSFSPLRTTLLNRGLIPRIAELISSQDRLFKLNALWVVKNLSYKATSEECHLIMDRVGWETLTLLLHDTDTALQEQVLNILRNIASSESGIEMLFNYAGRSKVIGGVTVALESSDDNVLCQGMFLLANLANGVALHRSCILSNSRILSGLRSCMTHSKPEARLAAVSCVKQLAQYNPRPNQELREAGIYSTLRHISVGNGGAGVIATSPNAGGHQMGIEEDREVRDTARMALRLLDFPDDLGD